MAASPYHIASLLDKMSSVDKDFRFMATNDLMTELQKDSIKLDDDSERKVVQSVLKLVEDKNGEVQNQAVQCLSPLVKKIRDNQVELVISTLCSNMFSDSERLRDISSVGLKTVIAELPHVAPQVATNATRNITHKLVEAVAKPDLNQYVLLETLDILGELIHRYGVNLMQFHESVLTTLLPLLNDPRPLSVRKRAYVALCYLATSCQKAVFVAMMKHLLECLERERQSFSSMTNTRTYIQAIATIGRQAGQRVSGYLEHIIPLIMFFVKSEEDDELKESCLQAFEAIVVRCFREATQYIPEIVSVCLKMLSHDPNYNYDSEEEADASMDTEDLEEGEEEEDDEYSDDDDLSWKVRRASAKCLAAILGSRPEMLVEFYRTVSPVLISRFKEREENVKADIFAAYGALLKCTKPKATQKLQLESDAMETEENPLVYLKNQTPLIVKALHRQLKDKSVKTRQGCFSLLTALVTVLPGALDGHIGAIVPGILYSLSDQTSTSNMKIDTMSFLTVLLTHHSMASLHPHIGTIIPAVVKAVDDAFYKITSEALLVLNLIVQAIRPLDMQCEFDFRPFVRDVYSCTLKKLRAADIDQEVKERAIVCMGQIIAVMGDTLQDELPSCLPIFVERLRNEITRLTTVRAITQIASSSLKIDISYLLPECIPLLSGFLRKNHRDLQLATLSCLNALFSCYSNAMTPELYKAVMDELPPLISDNDLHVSQLVLTLLCTVMETNPQSILTIKSSILPRIFQLLLSSLLQGSALKVELLFFSKLVGLDLPDLGFTTIFGMLMDFVYKAPASGSDNSFAVHRQAFRSIAKCIAAICSTVPTHTLPTVTKFISDVQSESSTDSVKLLCLLSIGEIGRQVDLSGISDLKSVILQTFSSPSEEVRSAASYTLGSVSAGNLSQFLPYILSEVHANPRRQYLLLHSLKEVITCHYVTPQAVHSLKQHVPDIWGVLFEHFESPEEGTRNVVAECVGKLTLVDPETLLPKLRENLHSASAFVRSTVVTALKYTISDQPQPIDSLLHSCIGEFLEAIGDADLNVRRVALVAFNSAVHNKPVLVRDLLDSLLPSLYQETHVRKELVREVEMGPFKHTVDDGLDLRKAAFECMYTLLETCLDRLDIFEFLSHVEDGLKDHYDIKMLTFLLLVRLSHLRPTALLQRIDKLIEPLRATLHSKVKANSVKQEFEKQDELKRSAMRAISALLTIPDSDKCPQLVEFVSQIKSNADTAQLFESIQQDASVASLGPSGTSEPMELS